MGRKSTIHRLEPGVRSHIERLLREDKLTLDELIADVREAFPEETIPSRSSLGRYRQRFEDIVKRMREQDTMARLLVSELGENPDEKAGALMVQAVTTLTTQAALAANETENPDTETVLNLARAAKDVINARKLSRQERKEIERDARERLLKEQEKNLSKVAVAQGMGEEQVLFWREKVLGIKK